jgi:biopolymer transport protein ExbD
MITRPLELASRLRPEPRSLDWIFFVNVGLIALFFTLFGSRFVLAPGVPMLAAMAGSDANARVTTHDIRVWHERQILAGDGLRTLPELEAWLVAQAKTTKEPVLLVHSNAEVSLELMARILSLARGAGFEVQVATVEPGRERPATGR